MSHGFRIKSYFVFETKRGILYKTRWGIFHEVDNENNSYFIVFEGWRFFVVASLEAEPTDNSTRCRHRRQCENR